MGDYETGSLVTDEYLVAVKAGENPALGASRNARDEAPLVGC